MINTNGIISRSASTLFTEAFCIKGGLHLQIEFDHQRRIVSVWLAGGEADGNLLEPLCRQYRGTPYRVAVFRSGQESLMECAAGLLRCNR